MKILLHAMLIAFFALVAVSCSDTTTGSPEEPAAYDPTPYVLDTKLLPPPPPLPADNQLTQATVLLGKMLFNERMLSKDESQSCADCHLQKDAFSDLRQFSIGVEGKPGKRQAMGVFNMAWQRPGPQRGFFWDGRAPRLRDQALMPIQDELEMNETLENCVTKLSDSKTYRDQFIRAFGDDTVTTDRMGLAMEQFMNTLVAGNNKHDRVLRGTETFTMEEQRGRDLFFGEVDPFSGKVGAECFHCHGGPNMTNDQYMNNGLDTDAEFTDLGRFNVSKQARDRARFRVTSLRNIDLTPPYMHDGRFETLEEVIDHYNTGAKNSATVEADLMQYNLRPGGLGLSAMDKQDLIAFLKTLTDRDLPSDPAHRP